MSTSSSATQWDDYARRFGMELQRRRAAAKLTQEQLAHQAGMGRNYLQDLERGFIRSGAPANPSLKVLLRLSQTLDVAPGELLPEWHNLAWQNKKAAAEE